jgi:hypothetical protein
LNWTLQDCYRFSQINFCPLITIKMFRAIAILASLVSAAAFAPRNVARTSSALKMSFESEIGAQAPLGFWDPLGLLANADQVSVIDNHLCMQ